MISFAYTMALLVAIAFLGIFIVLYSKRVSAFYTLAFGCVVVTNLGYLHQINADGLKAALFSNQTCYLGSCFLPFFFLMCIADLCKEQIAKNIQIFCGCVSAFIMTMVSTIGVFDFYYKDVEYVIKDEGYGMLVKDYGPLHTIYPAYLIFTSLLAVYCIYKAMRKKNEVPFSTSILLFFSMILSMLGYFGKGILGLEYEVIPFVYDVTIFCILILLKNISLLDLVEVTASSMFESDSYGFIVFDEVGNYLGSDVAAKKWFPHLEQAYVGKKFSLENPEADGFIKELCSIHHHGDIHLHDQMNRHIELGELSLEAVGSHIKRDFMKDVYCLYLRDDTAQQKLNKLNEQYQENLKREVETKTEKIKNIQNDIVISMASIVENRDGNTGGHIARTSDIVKIFVKRLQMKTAIRGLTEELAKNITKAAPLHDFGKIAIPDVILNKPGKFEPEEYEIMKLHSAKGADIVARILQNSNDEEFRRIAINVAHYHHERWDGKGYPDKLEGSAIPFEARVMALADVFDALVSKRVYKERMSYEKAFSIIEEGCGSQFDPILGKVFLECRQDLIDLYDSYED